MAASYPRQPHARQQRSPGPQLRQSCDACNTAKVKCSKTRPRCARCETRQATCVYGVSLRSAKGKAESNKDIASNGSSDSGNDGTNGTTLTAASMAFGPSVIPATIMPPLSETAFDASFLDGWNPQGADVVEPPNSAEPSETDDPVMILSNLYAENGTSASQRDPFGTGVHCNPRLPPLDTLRTPQSSHTNSPPSAHTCFCQQNILTKLSECWTSSRASAGAFDKALSENRNIIALCTATLHCSNRSHTDDTILMLTIIALLNQIITIYDGLVPLDMHNILPSSGSDLLLTDTASIASATSGNPTSATSTQDLHSPSLTPPQHVRLSLGSYQLDQRDEQILKTNLLVIELGKISDLIDLFERRFCSPQEWGGNSVGRAEPKPLGELVTHLRRRLRADQDSLRAWGSIS